MWIAKACAASGYNDAELDKILIAEVAPALFWNLYNVAGEWEGFCVDSMQQRILSRRGLGYWLDRLLAMRPAVWMMKKHWRKIKELLPDTRRQFPVTT